MALTVEEQELFDSALVGLPSWFQDDKRVYEGLKAYAKMVGEGRTIIRFWLSQTLILQAVGPVGTEPDWLELHATGRGTFRQVNEADVSLRGRIRVVEDALIRSSLLAATQAVLDAEGIPGTAAMVELRRDRGFFRVAQADAGTGGVYGGIPPDMIFTPTVPFAGVPFKPYEEERNYRIVFSGAASGVNNGSRVITGMTLNGANFTNGFGSLETDPGVSWVIETRDRDGNLLDGFRDSYFSRGDRFGGQNMVFIMILPFGCTTDTEAAVLEALRQKRGAGSIARVECRLVP